MRGYHRFIALIGILLLGSIIAVNWYMKSLDTSESARPYLVEVNRLMQRIKETRTTEFDKKEYPNVVRVAALSDEQHLDDFYTSSDYDYTIREINGKLYRFDYIRSENPYQTARMVVTTVMILVTIMTMLILWVLRIRIIKPLYILREVPVEISKGNLTMPLKENKNRFFGRFVWGLDLLRENIETHKKKELLLQKEKQTLILSISHDIKTPLSAIKLYAKAMSKNLYGTEEKRMEIANKIDQKTDEIENYILQIIQASKEEFLNLKTEPGEFYLGDLIKQTKLFYQEKLELLHITLEVSTYQNCILRGDLNRTIEVLQNIIENAIKYGDGKKIALSFSKEEDCRLITVKNSGCSLNGNELPHIFDSFWRGSNVANQSGNGLGLYICRQLMRNMQGDIYAELEGDWFAVTIVVPVA